MIPDVFGISRLQLFDTGNTIAGISERKENSLAILVSFGRAKLLQFGSPWRC